MRKLIFTIIFVLVGILCLSSTVRLSEELYEFFNEDNSSNTSSNSSNNSSDSDDAQSPGDNTGTLVSATTFKRTEERFGLNYSIDTSFYVKQNEYYYYKLDSDENKFVKSDVILEGKTLYTDCGDFVYVRVEEAISQDNSKSVLIDLDLLSGASVLPYKICNVNVIVDKMSDISNDILIEDIRYFISFFNSINDQFIALIIAPISVLPDETGGIRWQVNEGSALFGFTTFNYNLAGSDEFSDCEYYIYDF